MQRLHALSPGALPAAARSLSSLEMGVLVA
jgi:hypothetical protein